MTCIKTLLLLLPLMAFCNATYADSWTITQSTSATSSSTTILQEGSSAGAVQAVNSINLNGLNSTVNDGSSQQFNGGENNLTLRQHNGTTSSIQAINRVYAHTINGLTQGARLVGGPQNLTFDQASNIGNSNTQSLNDATTSVTGTINKLAQSVLDTATVTMQMTQSAGTQNVQAGNLIKTGELSSTSGDVSQTVRIGIVKQVQSNTSQSIQSGNALVTLGGSTATGGTLTQSFEGSSFGFLGFTFTQTSVSNSVQARNYAGEAL